MNPAKKEVLNQLKKEIYRMSGLHAGLRKTDMIPGFERLQPHFPNASFPLAAVHEFICPCREDVAATTGFVSALSSKLFKKTDVLVWICNERRIYPPALARFNVCPGNIVFIYPNSQKETLWVTEQALQCAGVAAVFAELNGINFLQSRRFQLAVEESHTTGFLLNTQQQKPETNACVSRWSIRSVASKAVDDLPGLGFPAWEIELQKMRNGKQGTWQLAWAANHFVDAGKQIYIPGQQREAV